MPQSMVSVTLARREVVRLARVPIGVGNWFSRHPFELGRVRRMTQPHVLHHSPEPFRHSAARGRSSKADPDRTMLEFTCEECAVDEFLFAGT